MLTAIFHAFSVIQESGRFYLWLVTSWTFSFLCWSGRCDLWWRLSSFWRPCIIPDRLCDRSDDGRCKAGVEIPTQRRPQTSPKVANLSCPLKSLQFGPVAYLSTCSAFVLNKRKKRQSTAVEGYSKHCPGTCLRCILDIYHQPMTEHFTNYTSDVGTSRKNHVEWSIYPLIVAE